ncbi:hypothetical protein ACLI4Q_07640 [Natrialbaceae archaeon A-CW1-1]
MTERTAADRIAYRRENAVDPETFLLEAIAVTRTEDGTNLQFTDAFQRAVNTKLETVDESGVDSHHIAALFGVDVEAVSRVDRPTPAFKIRHTIRNWSSDAALLVDVAVDCALREQTAEWDDVPGRQRYRILQSLRLFQEECPFCAGTVVMGDPGSRPTPTGEQELTPVVCDACDRLFAEFVPGSVPTK